MNFLPQGYEPTKPTGNYTKFQNGDTKIRIMSSAIVGFEYWNNEGKPVRSKEFPKTLPEDIRYDDQNQPEKIKEFWAFVVWNYNENRIQVCEITQAQIKEGILNYSNDEDWGDPKQYDLKINRTGEKLTTKYQVKGSPKTEVPMEAANAFAATSVNLEALFTGDDPFTSKNEEEVNLDNIPV
jgi:hypothetical protein